jgi:hypothetical protein
VLSRGEVVGAEAGAGKVSKDATKLECTSETRRCRETGGMGGGARQGKFKTTKADLEPLDAKELELYNLWLMSL